MKRRVIRMHRVTGEGYTGDCWGKEKMDIGGQQLFKGLQTVVEYNKARIVTSNEGGVNTVEERVKGR